MRGKCVKLARRIPWSRIASLAFGLGILVALVAIADPQSLIRYFSRIDLRWYIVAFLIFLLGYVPAIYRWLLLQRTVGYQSEVLSTFEIVAVSLGLNKVLPANAGDFTRTKVSERYYDVHDHVELMSLVAVERFADFIIVFVLFFTSSALLAADVVPSVAYLLGAGGVVGTLFLTVLFTWLVRTDRIRFLPDLFIRTFESATDGIGQLTRKTLALVLIATVVRWLLTGLVFLLVGQAVGYTPSIPLALSVVCGMSAISILPITPGGLGASEAAGVGILVSAGTPYSISITLTIVQRTFGVVWIGAIGTTVYLVRSILDG